MKVFVLPVSSRQLLNIPVDERVAFLTLGHIANELFALRKLILINGNTKAANDIEKDARSSQSLLFIKLFVLKIVAGWKFLEQQLAQPFFKEIALDADANIRENVKMLKSYFRGEPLLEKIRNQWVAHYDADEIRKGIELSTLTTSSFYFTNQAGNSLYWVSEELLFQAVASNYPEKTTTQFFECLIDDAHNMAAKLTDTVQGAMIAFGKKYFSDDWNFQDRREIDVEAVDGRKVELPFFVDFRSTVDPIP